MFVEFYMEVVAFYDRDHRTNIDAINLSPAPSEHCVRDQQFIFRFEKSYLDLVQPILWEESRQVGYLHIRQDMNPLNKRFAVYSVVMLFIVVVTSVVAIFLSARIQRFISTPLMDITAIAERVTQQNDFSIRAEARREDEIGKLVAAFNLMLDTIDEQNRALMQAKNQLEEQVSERTAELRNINRELEAFTYSVSHDLRSPLRSVEGFSTALKEDYASQLDASGKDYVDRIRSASQHMTRLIDSLLYLSRVSTQDLTRQAVDLVPIASEIVDRLARQYPTRTVNFICPRTLLAYGDKALMAIVLENLLSNAWKYSEKVPQPNVELGVVSRNGEQVYFVRDNGVGFDMKYAERLFGPFQRLHRSEDFEGLGIGLATAARVIHRHGGEIWAESLPGAGAVFYFTLGTRPG